MMRYDQMVAFAQGVHDDELCHCGRLSRYKNCCKPYTDPEALSRRIRSHSLVARTKMTAEAVRYFLFNRSSKDPYADAAVTADQVAQFYRYLSDVWPHRLDPIDSIRALRDEGVLTGFYVGDPRPETIVQNIARLALYTDRIFIPQPFYMAWTLRADYDPVQHPTAVMQDTRRWAVLTMMLWPWIMSGMVVFLPDPAAFDQKLRDAVLAAGRRREAEGKIVIPREDMEKYIAFAKADFRRQMLSMPDDQLIAGLRELGPVADADIPGILAYVQRERERDPLYVPGIIGGGSSLSRIRLPTIDETLLSCTLGNAFPFTDRLGKWQEINEHLGALPADAEIWSPLTRAFAQCQLEFLSIEDTRLAFQIREEGRLASFRSFMRSLWKSIDGSPDERMFPTVARDMADRLQHEHDVAAEEWRQIHSKFDAAVRRSAITTAVGGLTTALSGFGFLAIALSFTSHLLFSGAERKLLGSELSEFRTKTPMTIFLDIKS